MRKVVLSRLRTDYRRKRRERVASRPERIPADSDLLMRAELQQKVLDATLELAEPYRSTVLRRYFDERSCGEIARSEGVPASTVRNRLKRALYLLRGHLELSGTTPRNVWVAFLALAGFGSGARVAAAAPAAATLTQETTMETSKFGIVLSGLALTGVLVTFAVVENVETSIDTSRTAPARPALAAEHTPVKPAPAAKSDDAGMKERIAALEERVRARHGKGAKVKVQVQVTEGGLRGKSVLTGEAMKRALQLTEDQMARIETLSQQTTQRWHDLMITASEDGTTPRDLLDRYAPAFKKARKELDYVALIELQRKMNAYRSMKIRGSDETFGEAITRNSVEQKQAFSALLTEKQRKLYKDMEYMSKFAQPITTKSEGVSVSVTIPHEK